MPQSVPIPSQFLASPPGILTQKELVTGSPFSAGFRLINRPRGPIETDAFGIEWAYHLVPAGVGRTVGQAIITYEEYLAEITEIRTDIGATTFFDGTHRLFEDEGRFMFHDFPTTRCGLWVAPATEINVWWLLIL